MKVLVAMISTREPKTGWNCWYGASASLMLKVSTRFGGIEALVFGGEACKVQPD